MKRTLMNLRILSNLNPKVQQEPNYKRSLIMLKSMLQNLRKISQRVKNSLILKKNRSVRFKMKRKRQISMNFGKLGKSKTLLLRLQKGRRKQKRNYWIKNVLHMIEILKKRLMMKKMMQPSFLIQK